MKPIGEYIRIKGAKTHNLKNIDVDIPINQITTLYGPSGSGKTSLAFATLYQESKRRLINSLPTETKFFCTIPQSADVDSISPIFPAWALTQVNPIKTSRTAFCDLIDITEKIQQIFFLEGGNTCPKHKSPYKKIDLLDALEEKMGSIHGDIFHIFIRQEDYKSIYPNFYPSRSLDNEINPFDENDPWWEIIKLRRTKITKLKTLIRENPSLGDIGHFKIFSSEAVDFFHFSTKVCPICKAQEPLAIKNFSMLSPYHAVGACRICGGHGTNLVYDRDRLVKEPYSSVADGAITLLHFKPFRRYMIHLKEAFIKNDLSIHEPFHLLPEKKWKILYEGHGKYPGFAHFFHYFESKKYKKNIRIFSRKLKEEVICNSCVGTRIDQQIANYSLNINGRLLTYREFFLQTTENALKLLTMLKVKHLKKKFLDNLIKTLDTCRRLGLGNIPLSKKVKDLPASRYQRSLLIKFLSFQGSGSLFILDEPTVGLSLREQRITMEYLRKLRDQHNTILLIEHSDFMIGGSDYVIEMGPASGHHGGVIVSKGNPKKTPSLPMPLIHKKKSFQKYITIQSTHDDSFQRTDIPIGALVLIRGDSSIDKHKILMDSPDINQYFHRILSLSNALSHTTSKSTVGTYLGLTGYLRKYYASLGVSKALGLSEGHFSYNSSLGKCGTCQGRGVLEIEMNFLENVHLHCDDCQGMKLKPLYALISDGHSTYRETINDPIEKAFSRIKMTPKVIKMIQYLKLLNLNYLSVDRPLASLSGGERQRLRLLSEIQSRLKNILLVLENISFGLSIKELIPLIELLYQVKSEGNTVVVIDEHPLLERAAEHTVYFTNNTTNPRN